ncbi:TonB-dependent receptor [Sphingomonas oligophenolica]|uniref:TonB-dependent receptor n=1 Tax=Sphingomonas oligophenolica TaxID=301154 RepID=A0ABU9Y637_9SPHN
MRWIGVVALGGLAVATPAAAQRGQPAPDVVVTATGGLPGLAVDPDRLPVATQTVDAAALRSGGVADLLRALDGQAAGVTLNQAQGNPFQPNLLYRGYEASPLGGNAQGLAVYVDGVRFNQPFGDTMNWDLVPDIAVARLSLQGANPVLGLNALGGALSIDLKTGRDVQGVGGEAMVGRFGRRAVSAEAGIERGGLSAYVAGSVAHDDGWRDHSPSTMHQLYAQIGGQGSWGQVDLRLLGAETALTGNGTAPVELLDSAYHAVFTYPDRTANHYGRVVLSADLALGDGLRLKPSVHLDRLRQRTANGDLSDARPCDGDAALLCLDGADDSPLTDSRGEIFPAFLGDGRYAQLNATRTDTTGYGGELRLERDAPLAGIANHLAVGAGWSGARTRFSADSTIGALGADRGFAKGQGVIDMAGGPIRSVDLVARRDDIGLFVADLLSPARDVDVTIALRYNHAHVRLDDRAGTALDGRHGYGRVNPSIGAVWRVGSGLALYGDYAETSRAPTPAELSCADPAAPCSLSAFFVADPDLRQVVARTVEAGVRGRRAFGGATLRWRVGGWRSTNADDILFTAAATVGRAFFRNVGATRRQGIEAQASLAARDWSATASYVLTDARFRTGFTAQSPNNPAAGPDGLIEVLPGDRLPGIARNRLKAAVTRRFGDRAWVTLEGQYASGRWPVGDEANLTRPTNAYWRADLSAGLRPSTRIELFAAVENLFDRRYATFGAFSETGAVDFAEAPGIRDPRAISPGTPRLWKIGVRLSP